jgi:CheY-like chemotaxis protein
MEDRVKKQILLIDDDTSLLITLSDFLIHDGYDVMTANSGEQGLKVLEDLTPDLIILDMSMPGMDGVGFLREASDSSGKPRYPVMVLTARANMAESFAEVEVDGFVAKPCDPQVLLAEVARIIFQRSGETVGSGSSSSGGGGRVLLAEDDAQAALLISSALRNRGYDVVSVAAGPDVLERAIIEKPDIVVVKQILANMNGDAISELLHKMPNTQSIPIILYDDTVGDGGHPDYTDMGTGIRKFLTSAEGEDIASAVNGVIG